MDRHDPAGNSNVLKKRIIWKVNCKLLTLREYTKNLYLGLIFHGSSACSEVDETKIAANRTNSLRTVLALVQLISCRLIAPMSR